MEKNTLFKTNTQSKTSNTQPQDTLFLIVSTSGNQFIDSYKDCNFFMKLKRKTQSVTYNEYIPSGFFSMTVNSQSSKTIYWLPKINPNNDYTDNLDFDFNCQIEYTKGYSHPYGHYMFPDATGMNIFVNPNKIETSSSYSGGNYGSVSSGGEGK